MSKDKTTAPDTPNTITLDEPIKREGGNITTISLRKPKSGELRGLQLVDLLQLDVNALQKLLPRITEPSITEQEARRLEPSDLVQLGTEVVLFLAPKDKLEDSQPA